MSQDFVRYRPDIERADPDFEQHLDTVLEHMKQNIKRSVEVEGIQRAVRDAHAKGYGLARGEVEILKGLPDAYAQGIYAKPGHHEAMVRFSNGTSHTGADRFLGAIVGIGLKMFGIEGETLLEDEPDSHTFDYAMISHPTFSSTPSSTTCLFRPCSSRLARFRRPMSRRKRSGSNVPLPPRLGHGQGNAPA